jgi:hypothetical protein
MTAHVGLFLVAAILGALGPRDSEPARYELLILDPVRGRPCRLAAMAKTDEEEILVRKAPRRRPLFVVHAADIETYIWKTQRITLTREASARLAGALVAAERSRQAGQAIEEGEAARALTDRVFQVRLNGEYLYGGFFYDPSPSCVWPHPVIHAEWIEGRAIFYVHPRHVSDLPDEFEESVGASRYFGRIAHPQALPADFHEDPAVLKYRAVLRDSRVRALFAGLGKLIPEPPPPVTPQEIRIALIQTDLEVHRSYAAGYASIETVLHDRYRGPDGSDKSEMVQSMRAGQVELPFYVVLATEPPELTGERSATLRSLIAMRGKLGRAGEVQRIVVSNRRYEFNPPSWLLVREWHDVCADDTPGPWRLVTSPPVMWSLRTGLPQLNPEPCWPPRKAPAQ